MIKRWLLGSKIKNKSQTMYREGWVNPPVPPEPLRSRMNKWFTKRMPIIIGMTALAGICTLCYSGHLFTEDARLSDEADELAKKESLESVNEINRKAREKANWAKYWQRVKAEAKVCEPMFFVTEKLVAHKLWQVTCMDEAGETYIKFVKGKAFLR